MPGIHKNNTISFRPTDWEREMIEARIRLSGLQKRDFFVRSCLYSNIVVVGKKENITIIVEAVEKMHSDLKRISERLEKGCAAIKAEDLIECRNEYIALVAAIVDILNGAAYLMENDSAVEITDAD